MRGLFINSKNKENNILKINSDNTFKVICCPFTVINIAVQYLQKQCEECESVFKSNEKRHNIHEILQSQKQDNNTFKR